MTSRLHWRALYLLGGLLYIVTLLSSAENVPASAAPSEKGVTFSHVYKIDVPGTSSCKVESLPSKDQAQDQTGVVTTVDGENVVFSHNIRLRMPQCDCGESESFKSLLYRVNGLEEEVNYLKTQCSQGCCGSGGVDTSCSGHGTYSHETCSCQCDAGWEGPDCSVSACPDDCNDNGRCVDGKCVCHQGFTGHDCSELLCPNNCNDKGHCVDGRCVCFSHFTGEDCGVQRCLNDCVGNGRCVDGQCICEEGFFGDDCSLVLGPKGLQLVRVTEVSLLVEWESVRGAEYYVLTYQPKGDDSALEEVRVSNAENSYLITDLTPGVTYIVEVYAVIKQVKSEADSIEASTETIDDIMVVGQTEDSIQVDWRNPAAAVDHFRLIHIDPEGQEEEQDIQMSQEARTRHTIMGLNPGTEYQITVQAIKGNVEGKPSSVTGVTDIDAPTNLVTIEVTEDTAYVTWDRIQSEIDSYVLSYSSVEGSSGEIPVGPDSSSYRLVGLRPGVLYTVYIWAVKGDRVSRKSSTQAETELDAPTNLSTREETESTFLVSWDRVQADIEGYVLSYSSAEGSSQEISVGPDSSSYRLNGLKPGVLYTVYIRAVRGDKSSRTTSTQGETELDAPTNLLAREETESTLLVSWEQVQADVEGYVLSYSSAEGSSQEISVGPDSSSYRLVGLRPGVLYTVYIWAVRGNKASRKTSTQGETELDAPTNLLAREETESTFLVSWEQVQADIEGYVLSYSSAEGSSEEISVGPDSSSYRLVGLRPGVLYTVYIWAVRGNKASKKTSTKGETDIDAPKDLKATDVTLDSSVMSWLAPLADIDGYILTYRSEDGTMETVEKQLGAGESRFALSGLEMSKRYLVTIIAYRGAKRSKVVETVFKTVGLLYPFPMDCVQIMKNGNKKSGIYTVYINSDRSKPIEVFCDMDNDGGGWLVFQRRNSGRLDFMKRWRQYIAGFGNMTDEFWLGMDKIYELTNTPTQYELRVELGLGSERAYAVYDNFKIAPAKQKFKLTIGKYRGTAGDAMIYHQGRPWSTVDSDNDIALGNCALTHRGAWWYKNCHLANLNGKWGDQRHSMGVNWEPWKGHLTSLDFTEMKIRPVGAMSSRKKRSLMAKERNRTTSTDKK